MERPQVENRIAEEVKTYPKVDKELGVLFPSTEEIAKAIARRDKARIVPTGVQALNKLGLSTQVPMKVVYLTDGAARTVKVGKRTAVLSEHLKMEREESSISRISKNVDRRCEAIRNHQEPPRYKVSPY
jgi:hypothetical protein